MTGQYPFKNTTIKNSASLPGDLHALGYRTCAVIGTNVARDFAHADEGFDVFIDNRTLKTNKDTETSQASTIARQSIPFLASTPAITQPTFLWLFFKDPHWPYLPPPEYRETFIDDELYMRTTQSLAINEDPNNSIGGIGEARLKNANNEFITNKAYYISQYDAEIAYLDSQIGLILSYLKQQGTYDDWMIIFSSDHGESLGEDNYFFDHGYMLNQEVVRIPLIVKAPHQKACALTTSPVAIFDIYRIIKTLLGQSTTGNLQGRIGPYIALENSAEHEKTGEKRYGGVSEKIKFIYSNTSEKAFFYDISIQHGERPMTLSEIKKQNPDRTLNEARRFFRQAPMNVSSQAELKSLGYLQ